MSSARAEAVYRRTYSRPMDSGFEQWSDTVDRVIRHQRWLWQRALGDVPLQKKQQEELEELRVLLLARKASVSGRTLWLGGTSVSKRREASMFNCAFTKVETVHDVVDAFWLLLQGCGVGFEPKVGTLNGFTRQMDVELVRSQRHLLEQTRGREHNLESYTSAEGRSIWTISIGDSAESWAKAVGKLLAGKRSADVLRLDFQQIRPAGERLAGYGWISSGDETFAPALEKIAGVLNRRSGQLLTRMDILDILNLLGTTLSSRRSAEIALVPYGDREWRDFALAKKDFWLHGNEHRQQSNNSLLFYQKPTRGQLEDFFDLMREGGGSEPGFVNGEAAKKRAPWFSGCNPCVPGDTPILTDKGYVPIKDRVGLPTLVWNGEQLSEVAPFSTGVNPLVEVKLSDGTSLKCTLYHEWILVGGVRVMAEELRAGDRLEKFAMPFIQGGEDYAIDAYSQGFYAGDGNKERDFSWIYEPKYAVCSRLIGKVGPDTAYERRRWDHGPMFEKNFVPVNGSRNYCLNWLAGVLDADGTVTRDINGNGLQLASIDKDFLLQVRLMLTRLGVRAKVVAGIKAGMRVMPDGRGGCAEYFCKDGWRLLIGNYDTYNLMQNGLVFNRLKVHSEAPQRDARRFVLVEEVVQLENFEETFCFTESKANRGTFNGIVTGQCAEILLPNKGFCNLVEINLSAFNGEWECLLKAVHLLSRANYRQTCVNLRDGVLQSAWHENNEFLRLCGVGVTGVVGWSWQGSEWHWNAVREMAQASANNMADELGLPKSKAVTTIKPSGTLSKVMDTTEGIHKPLGKYIFNNVRFSKHDPLVKQLRKAGYKVFNDPTSTDAVLVTFPVVYEDVTFDTVNEIEVNIESAVAQLERYKCVMENYVDHNCSITISYDLNEVPAIIDWLLKNWDIYVGVSFIYRNDPTKTAADLGYLYLPQEVVTKTAYDTYVAGLRELTFASGKAKEGDNEYEIDTGGECSSGACPIR